jgi:hypothetical protein
MEIIDLHGFRHREVSTIVSKSCSECDIPFIVITGKSSQMKKIVAAVARSFGLSTRDVIDNPGRVIIDEPR